MFGIIKPCRHRLSDRMMADWTAHLCGLCLALRDQHGQLARAATNYDGLVVSVLVEAQRAATSTAGRRRAGPCPLRRMRGAEVADGEGARLAAAVSLALAAAKVGDHVADGDGVFAHRPAATGGRLVGRRWARQSAGAASALGFDTDVLLASADRQAALEQEMPAGGSVLLVTEPTETATAAAFAHTAVLAGKPANAPALAEAGGLFGRLAHLLDAVEDVRQDDARGAWNPLTASGTDLVEAERLCRDAVHGIRLALAEVEFTDRELIHLLLAHETERAVERAFRPVRPAGEAAASGPGTAPPGPDTAARDTAPPASEKSRRQRRGTLAGCAVWTLMACTCQLMCCEHNDPWSRERRDGWCGRQECCNDCGCGCGDDCDCRGCTNCCDGCDGCDCSCD